VSGDLKIAAKLLKEGHFLVVVRDGRVLFSSRLNGVKPLLDALDSNVLPGSSVSSRVVGRAAAMIAAQGEVTAIHTPLISNEAIEVLTEARILYCATKIVPAIMNHDNTRLCPIEAATEFTVVPEKGVNALREIFNESPNIHQVH